eukprot:ANDGO_07498.mRNA.1 hypothetical protein
MCSSIVICGDLASTAQDVCNALAEVDSSSRNKWLFLDVSQDWNVVLNAFSAAQAQLVVFLDYFERFEDARHAFPQRFDAPFDFLPTHPSLRDAVECFSWIADHDRHFASLAVFFSSSSSIRSGEVRVPELCSRVLEIVSAMKLGGSHEALRKSPKPTSIAPSGALIREFRNSAGHVLTGEWSTPACVESPAKECAVLIHGLGGSRNDSLLEEIASAIPVASFRFDLSGNGESEGKRFFGNVYQELCDLVSAIEYVQSIEGVRVRYLIGHSQGGTLVLMLASLLSSFSLIHPNTVVVDIAGRLNSPLATERFASPKMKAELAKLRQEEDFEWFNMQVNASRVHTRMTVDLPRNVVHSPFIVHAIHGTKDPVVPCEDSRQLVTLIARCSLHLVHDADHSFTKHRAEVLDVVTKIVKTC